MTYDQFVEQYPHLGETLGILGSDNNMPWNKECEVPLFLRPVLKKFDEQASQLTEEEKEIMAAGDHDEMLALVARTGFDEFSDFLNEAFQGYMSRYFFDLEQ